MSHSPLGRTCAAAALAVSILASAPAWAQPLTLAEAQALAVARSQQLVGNKASIAASREMAIAAGQLPDPVLKLGIENLPVDGPDRLSLSRDFMTMRRIGLSQELPSAQKRQLRSERFVREADRMRAEGQLALANIQRETALAWIERHYTQQMRELLLRQIEEGELQFRTATAGFGAGRSSQSDVLAARAALVLLQDRLAVVDKQDANASWVLARWLGGPAVSRPASGTPAWETSHLDGGQFDEHIQSHPDLAMLRAQLESAQAEARLVQANRQADWSVEAMYSQRGPGYSNMVSLGVSIPLQWDRKNRQDRELAAKLALVDEAQAKYEEMRRQHESDVRTRLIEWRSGKDRVTRYQDLLVPLAQRQYEAALTEYRAGRTTLAATLAARRGEVDMRLQALAVEMETARAWAQLNFLIPDPSLTATSKEKP